jgi:hypothetical protein
LSVTYPKDKKKKKMARKLTAFSNNVVFQNAFFSGGGRTGV